MQESRIKESEEKIELALVTSGVKIGKTWSKCGKKGPLSTNCWQNNKGSDREDKREIRSWLKRGKPGRIAKHIHLGNETSKNKIKTSSAIMTTVEASRFSRIQTNANKGGCWTQA